MTKQRVIVVAAVAMAAVLALAGCGGSSGPRAFLASTSSQVLYVQWQPDSSGSGIQGTITADSISGTAPSESVSVQDEPFTGSINGSSVTLDVDGGFLAGTSTLYATLNGSNLTINTLSSGGSIQSGSLQQAGTSSYNQAVAVLHHTIQQANAQALAEQQAQAQQQANAQAEQAAQSDLSTLESAGDFSSDLNSLASDVTQTGSDLAGEKKDAASGVNGPGGPACYNLEQNVDYDATQNVEYDAQQDLGYDLQQNLSPDISAGRADITTVRNDLTSLNADGLPAPAGASAAITAAGQAISRAITMANGDIDQVNADVADAYALANGMATSSCTGPGDTPASISHLG